MLGKQGVTLPAVDGAVQIQGEGSAEDRHVQNEGPQPAPAVNEAEDGSVPGGGHVTKADLRRSARRGGGPVVSPLPVVDGAVQGDASQQAQLQIQGEGSAEDRAVQNEGPQPVPAVNEVEDGSIPSGGHVTKADFRRLARREGVYRMAANVPEEANSALRSFLVNAVQKSGLFAESSGRKISRVGDVVEGLKTAGTPCYILVHDDDDDDDDDDGGRGRGRGIGKGRG